MKKVNIRTQKRAARPADKWVGLAGEKRLTIDVTEEMHKKFKKVTAARGISMRDAMVKMIGRYIEKVEG